MNLSLHRKVAFLLAVIFLIGLQVSPARAGFAVSPLKQEITVKPGEPGKYTINLSNRGRTAGDATQSMHLTVCDVAVNEDGTLNFSDPGSAKQSASKWITLSRSDVTLEPNTAAAVEFTVDAPISAVPGEYYTAIMVTLGNKVRNDKGMLVEYRIAAGVFVTIPGRTFPKQAKITRCELLWPVVAQPGQEQPADTQSPKVSLTVHNYGQARLDAAGKMSLFDDKQRLVFAGPLITKRACIFGGDSRLFETPITKPIPPGRYTVKVRMDCQTWAPLYQTLTVDITPEQASLLNLLKSRQPGEKIGLEVTPDNVQQKIPAGGSRTVAMGIKNVVDVSVSCTAAVFPTENSPADAWISIPNADYVVTKGSRRSVVLSIQVPKGTKSGKYSTTVALEGAPEGTDPSILLVPVEIEVKAEK